MTDYLFKTAEVSDCRKYRYVLERIWDTSLLATVFIMLNPSTADAKKDDPTIRACVEFAKRWGTGGLTVVNLFAFRSTFPEGLNHVNDPFGPFNYRHVERVCKSADIDKVICAWGSKIPKKWDYVGTSMIDILENQMSVKTYALKINDDGEPRHPLYIKRDTKPFRLRKE